EAQAGAIAVDDGYVYWAAAHAIKRCAKSGCNNNPTVLATSDRLIDVRSLALDSNSVYWARLADLSPDLHSIVKCPKAGCGGPPPVIASSLERPLSFPVQSSNLFMTAPSPNSSEMLVMSCPSNGCGSSPTLLATSNNTSFWQRLAVDPWNVYF